MILSRVVKRLRWDGQRRDFLKLLGALLALQILIGIGQRGFRDPKHPMRHPPSKADCAAGELFKMVLCLILIYSPVFASPRPISLHPMRSDAEYHMLPGGPGADELDSSIPIRRLLSDNTTEDPDHALNERLDESELPFFYIGVPERLVWPEWNHLHLLIVLGLLSTAHQGINHSLHRYADARTITVVQLLLILFTAAQMQLVLERSLPFNYWTSALLQISINLLQNLWTKFERYAPSTYALLIGSTWTYSIVLTTTAYVYQRNARISIHGLNFVLFSCIFGANLGSVAWDAISGGSPLAGSLLWQIGTNKTRDSFVVWVMLIFRALADIVTIYVIRYISPFAVCAVALLSSAIYPWLSWICFETSDNWVLIRWITIFLSVFAALSYFRNPTNSTLEGSEPRWRFHAGGRSADSPPKIWPPSRFTTFYVCILALPIAVALLCFPLNPIPKSGSFVWNGSRLDIEPLPPHKLLPAQSSSECRRKPLPASSRYAGSGERPDFHAFDDILLVTFFSHARYDVNLEGYREAYSKYFPNIIFIGPASREDRGFLRSYEITIDSYKSEEDFSQWDQMAGRMAHHMFYTAVMENPCYAGYLWAPFDTFLNIPRLMQFPQDKIWYHSPFGKYIPNPAQNNSMLHPHPASISSKSPDDYEWEASRWGGRSDWWWGNAHVGLPICMPAYREIPQRFRDRLTGMLNVTERFIGGSVDTVYLPAHLRDDFLDTLAIFLKTDCFLEIALPTALHMILPENEEIAYTDHWWISRPPFNTDFVRQKWREGYEVDSFHTFHWGDVHRDGFWRANEGSLDDVRAVLQDSAVRQGVKLP